MTATQPKLVGMAVPGGSEALSAPASDWLRHGPDRTSASRQTALNGGNAHAKRRGGCIRRHIPAAPPAPALTAGKQKTAPKDRFDTLISLRKSGAGEGIRTLDPNLGKVVLYP